MGFANEMSSVFLDQDNAGMYVPRMFFNPCSIMPSPFSFFFSLSCSSIYATYVLPSYIIDFAMRSLERIV